MVGFSVGNRLPYISRHAARSLRSRPSAGDGLVEKASYLRAASVKHLAVLPAAREALTAIARQGGRGVRESAPDPREKGNC